MATKKKKPRKRRKIVWFAKGGGIAKSGPYRNAVDAAAAMTLVRPEQRCSCGAVSQHATQYKPNDFAIWPEYADE